MLQRLAAALAVLLALAAPLTAGEPAKGPNGLYTQPWFQADGLDLEAEFRAAKAEGKGLIVLVEQRGCIYCRKLHEVNFARAEIVALYKSRFVTVQLDMFGDRAATDLDGSAMTERALVKKWGITATPATIILKTANVDDRGLPRDGMKLPGYLIPFYHFAALDYLSRDAAIAGSFDDYLATSVASLKTTGTTPETW